MSTAPGSLAYRLKLLTNQNAEVLFQSDAFLQIDQELLCALFGSNQLQINGEISLWNAALRWADEQCRRNGIDCSAANRRQMLGPALFNIRFPLIPRATFMQSIVPSGVLTNEEIFNVLLHHSESADLRARLLAVYYPPHFVTIKRAKPKREKHQKSFVSGILSSICRGCNKIMNAVAAFIDSNDPWLFYFVLSTLINFALIIKIGMIKNK